MKPPVSAIDIGLDRFPGKRERNEDRPGVGIGHAVALRPEPVD